MFILFVCFCYLFHCMIFYIRIHHIDIYQVVYRTILVLIICIITDTAHFGYCLKDELDFRFASPVFLSSIMKRKLTVNSLSTNINKTNNCLLHQIIEHKEYHDIWFCRTAVSIGPHRIILSISIISFFWTCSPFYIKTYFNLKTFDHTLKLVDFR